MTENLGKTETIILSFPVFTASFCQQLHENQDISLTATTQAIKVQSFGKYIKQREGFQKKKRQSYQENPFQGRIFSFHRISKLEP